MFSRKTLFFRVKESCCKQGKEVHAVLALWDGQPERAGALEQLAEGPGVFLYVPVVIVRVYLSHSEVLQKFLEAFRVL